MDSVDIRIAFILIACVLASSALMLFIFVRHETAQKETERMVGFGDLKKVFKVREVRLMFPIWLIVATLFGIALTYLPIILLGQHVKGTTIGIAFAGAGVVSAFFNRSGGKYPTGWDACRSWHIACSACWGLILHYLFYPNLISIQGGAVKHVDILGVVVLGLMGLGVGAFVPSALALMADSADSRSYGATMGLYSFALGFGEFVASAIGLLIILITGKANAPTWLLYFGAVLIGLAVLLMILFFISNYVRKRVPSG